jgi:hypothetical protein
MALVVASDYRLCPAILGIADIKRTLCIAIVSTWPRSNVKPHVAQNTSGRSSAGSEYAEVLKQVSARADDQHAARVP